jgi:hypothetical protein
MTMHTDELRREIVAMADEVESFAGDVETLHRKRRRNRSTASVIAIAAVLGLAAAGVAVTASRHGRVVRVSSAPSKEVDSSKITHIDAIVVPANEPARVVLDESNLVAEYALVPRVQVPESLLQTKAWRSALCALRSSDGYAVTATTVGRNLAADLSKALGAHAKVYAVGDRYGSADAEIFMTVGATPAETAALRTRLSNDRDIESFRYISASDAYAIFKVEFGDQPALVQSTKVGDLPQSFRINVVPGRSVAQIVDRYSSARGVDTVIQEESIASLRPSNSPSEGPPAACAGS